MELYGFLGTVAVTEHSLSSSKKKITKLPNRTCIVHFSSHRMSTCILSHLFFTASLLIHTLLCLFYQCRNWGSESFIIPPRSQYLINYRAGIRTQSDLLFFLGHKSSFMCNKYNYFLSKEWFLTTITIPGNYCKINRALFYPQWS